MSWREGWGTTPRVHRPLREASGRKMVDSLVQAEYIVRRTCSAAAVPGVCLNTLSAHFGPRIHISVQIPHQDGMLPLISTMPLHNLHFLLSESIYRHQHVCSNLVSTRDLRGISGEGRPPRGFPLPAQPRGLGTQRSGLCFPVPRPQNLRDEWSSS